MSYMCLDDELASQLSSTLHTSASQSQSQPASWTAVSARSDTAYARPADFALTADNCRTLRDYALLVLHTSDSNEKVSLTFQAYTLFSKGELDVGDTADTTTAVPLSHRSPPDCPARSLDLNTVSPQSMPVSVKGDAEGNRIRLLHSLAHIESIAIDLSFDVLVRWIDGVSVGYFRQLLTDCGIDAASVDSPLSNESVIKFPREFYIDWLRVACEESRHFTCWANRLKELGSHYGALPVHDSLWSSAYETKEDPMGRLCVVHGVHEAHGLDASARMCKQLQSMSDTKSARLLAYIESDEITHVRAGITWFNYLCEQFSSSLTQPLRVQLWHGLVRRYFRGSLRGPFNEDARTKAGMSEDYYKPLADTKFDAYRAEKARRADDERRERDAKRELAKAAKRADGLAKAAAMRATKAQG